MKTSWHFLSGQTTAVVLLALLTMSGCGGKEERMAKYMEKGKTYLANEDYDKARVEIKNVLQIDPKYAEAYFIAGQIEEKEQAWPKAFGNYLKVTELDPNHLAAKVRLGRFYVLSGETAKAEALIKEVLAKQPSHAGAGTLKAALLARDGDIDGVHPAILLHEPGASRTRGSAFREIPSAPTRSALRPSCRTRWRDSGEAARSGRASAGRGWPKPPARRRAAGCARQGAARAARSRAS